MTPDSRIPILIAEDSEDNRFLLQAYCRGTAYQLTFAEDGEQAVIAYQSGCVETGKPFEIVVMDIQMPVMDGLMATRLIRSFEAGEERRRTPIVALTANVMPHDVALVREAGCDLHLPKPISKRRFLGALEQWEPGQGEAHPPCRVEISAGLEQVALSYLIARQRELPLIRDLLRSAALTGPAGGAGLQEVARDAALPELERIAHNLKITGTSCGFPDITRLGAGLAGALEARDATAVSHHVEGLAVCLESASQQLRKIG